VDRSRCRKLIKDVWWPGRVWVGECFFWYRPTRVVPDQRLLNSCVWCACLNSRPAVVVDPYPCLATVWRHWTPRLVTREISSAVPTPHTSDSQNTRKINAMTKCAALVSEFCNRSELQTWGPIYKISYDNAKVTIDLRQTSHSQNILRRMQGFSRIQFACKLVKSSEIAFVN